MRARNPNSNREFTILVALAIIIWALILLGSTSCSVPKCLPERVEIHDTIQRTDTQYIYRYEEKIVYRERKDSTHIYEKDSVSEKQRGDTIYITKWRVKYQYVYKATTDSAQNKAEAVDKTKTEQKQTTTEKEVVVKTERYIPAFYKFTMWLFWIVVVVLVGWLLWWLADYIPALGTAKNWIRLILKIK